MTVSSSAVLLYSWMPPIIQFSHLACNWSLNGLLTFIRSRGLQSHKRSRGGNSAARHLLFILVTFSLIYLYK
jgi:hypothetical protein